MLHQSGSLPILRVITLQAFAERNNHRAVEICIFAVAFLVPAPTWITPNISLGRSDYDPARVVLRALKNVASLVSFNLTCLSQYILIPGFTKPNTLWKRRRRNGLGSTPFSWSTLSQSVNAFDVSACPDAESRHTRISMERRDLLLDRHQRKDVVNSLFDREVWVLKGILSWRRSLRRKHGNAGHQDHQANDIGHGLLATDCTDPSTTLMYFRSSGLVNLVTNPLGHLISMLSILVALPMPRISRGSCEER